MIFTENKNIFQIFLSDDPSIEMPNELILTTNSINVNSNNLTHFILKNNELEEILRKNMDSEVINAYNKLVPYSYKADLGRFCLLYLFGGWYFDISVTVTTPLPEIIGLSHVVFRDAPNPSSQTWDTSTSVIYAERGSLVMKNAIEQIIDNCNNNWYGINALCPTGPSVLGRALAFYGSNSQVLSGLLLSLTPKHQLKNNGFVLPDGRILAWGKKTWGTIHGDGLTSLGAKGTDSYAQLYHEKKIYKII